MSDLAQYSKSELAQSLQRAKGMIKRANEKTKEIAERGISSGLTVGAGYLTGVAKNKIGSEDGKVLIPGTNVEADLAAGIVLSLAGVGGLGGNRSTEIAAVGSGILAGYTAVAGYLHGLPGANR